MDGYNGDDIYILTVMLSRIRNMKTLYYVNDVNLGE
jgi:hypothetical protein